MIYEKAISTAEIAQHESRLSFATISLLALLAR